MTIFRYAPLAALAAALSVSPASAQPDNGYTVNYEAGRDRYCLRPTDDDRATQLGIVIYSTECNSAEGWLASGLRLWWSDGTPIAATPKR